ncbi:MAG: hypothetical protein ACXW07_10175 [Nitrososphaeraceae archaeon]
MSQINGSSKDNSQGDQDNGNSQNSNWVDLIGALFDRLTGKEAVITYEFENLIVDIPRASGPGGKELGSAKWTVNGKLIIKAEAVQK